MALMDREPTLSFHMSQKDEKLQGESNIEGFCIGPTELFVL